MAERRSDSFPVPVSSLVHLLGGLGLLFATVAGADNVLTWLPTDFGNREWEFGTVTASFNGLLSVTLGLALVQLWLTYAEKARTLRLLGVMYLVLVALVVAAALLYWTNVPVAWGAVPEGPVRTGLLKAILKTSLQTVAFPVAYLLLARTSFRWAGIVNAGGARASAATGKGPGILARER